MILIVLTLILFVLLIALVYLKPLYDLKRKITVFSEELGDDGKRLQTIETLPQPPAPFYWPVIGHLPSIGKYPNITIALNELSKQYGNIYSVLLGVGNRMVILSDLELFQTVLNKYCDQTDARPDFIRFHMLFGGDRNECK